MHKIIVALGAVLAVLGATQIASATSQSVASKTQAFTVNVPALGPDGTLAEFSHCDPDLADNDPATPQDNKGCIYAEVSGDTDATLTMKISTASATVTAIAKTTATHPEICNSGEVGAQIGLIGVVGGSKVEAIYDPTPGTPPNGDSTKLVLSPPGGGREPRTTVCV